MMERMLRHELERRGIPNIHIESAGLMESAAGQPMAEFSMNELEQRGIDSEGHVSRYVGAIDLMSFDIVLTVGEYEAHEISSHLDCPNLVITLNEGAGGIPNPWQQGEDAYRVCAETIERCVAEFVTTFTGDGT
jgi:protein-tyrosine-phosphatase